MDSSKIIKQKRPFQNSVPRAVNIAPKHLCANGIYDKIYLQILGMNENLPKHGNDLNDNQCNHYYKIL